MIFMERLPGLDVKVSEVGGLLKKRRIKRNHYEFREARLFRFSSGRSICSYGRQLDKRPGSR